MIDALALASPSAAGGPPLWTIFPFAAYLLIIAVFPLFLNHFWEHNKNKLIVAVLASLPVAIWLFTGAAHGGHLLHESLLDYVQFIALLGALFTITGGIYLKGSLAGTPLVNTAVLGLGALLASFIGTTGASMLLIRPLLRANEKRQKKVHLVIFFIFIVSNGAGMLTPLGDPPLFLGFLKGVPFFWTMKLIAPWALVNGVLLALFNVVDQAVLNKEEKARAGSQLEDVQKIKEPLSIQGGLNFLWLLGVVASSYCIGKYKEHISSNLDVQALCQVGAYALVAGLSLKCTSKEVRTANKFSWAPIIEVAVIFIGIFITMIPALEFLRHAGHEKQIVLSHPWQYFWLSGALSSFLDNAPTYLVFLSLGQGADVIPADLKTLDANIFLMAISAGSVFMGANTYIGNGPNFMVKAIAEENQVKMPSFFGYMAWSCAILIPLFIVVTFIFFRA
jgi:Na+/H+ antiporter NhaD/arsenite permease-like protein